MKTFIKMFMDSAKEFKNLRSVVSVALLVALHTVMALFLSIQVTTSLRISLSFLANVMIGCMFGPVMGFVAGGLGDLIQFVIKPTGPYFIGWTISAALAGLIYGCFFYGKTPKLILDHDKTKTGKHGQEQTDKISFAEKMINLVNSLLAAGTGAVLIAAPFLEITKKAADGSSSTIHGSALYLLGRGIAGDGSKNAMILTIIAFVLCVFLIATPWLRWYKTSLTVSVVGTFLLILAVYSDKKTTSALFGFWMMCVLLLIYAVLQLLQVAKKHSMDFTFLVRCIIALTFDTILINILLGTYWVSFMYGKGFAFYLTTRLVKNLVQLPINIILTYYVLGILKRIKAIK